MIKFLKKIFNRKNVVFEEAYTIDVSNCILPLKEEESKDELWFPVHKPEDIETLITDMKRAKALNDLVRNEIIKKADDFEKSLKKKRK